MTLEYLKEYCEDYCESFPSFKDQIMEFYDLAVMETEGGGNEDHECELAVGDINAFINGELLANRNATLMEVFVLLKGYDYEGFGSDVEVFSTRDAAEARRQAYRDGNGIVDNQNPNITYDYGYDILKIVKRTIK